MGVAIRETSIHVVLGHMHDSAKLLGIHPRIGLLEMEVHSVRAVTFRTPVPVTTVELIEEADYVVLCIAIDAV
jgi:hypothetical protein